MTSSQPTVRVVRGSLTDEELAAVTAVLLARAAASAKHGTVLRMAGRPEPVARWQRLERRPPYHSPVSWRAAA